MAGQKLLSAQDIAEHKTPEDCWIVVDNQVWDVTDFLDEHPGGSASTKAASENCLRSANVIFAMNSHLEICRP